MIGASVVERIPRLKLATGRRRRPSGEPPPLARPIYPSGRLYVATMLLIVAGAVLSLQFTDLSVWVTRLDLALLRRLEAIRSPRLGGADEVVAALSSVWAWRLIRWTTLAALVACRRFRHLAVYLGLLLVVTAAAQATAEVTGRMRPAGIEALADWTGYAFPSRPVVALGLSLVGVMYTLVPRGLARNRAKIAAAGVMTLLIAGRLYVGIDHPTDAIVGLIVGMALPVVVFRFLTPDEVFPIRYRTAGHRAELGAHRVRAIGEAVASGLGWEVVEVVALRPPGSKGSTPLRLVVRRPGDGSDTAVFAKLYSQQHLRADRWYKLARTILYGRLEDEHAFASVRRLVEHEDHLLRVSAAAGLPVPATFGYVTLTPEREYLLVTELLPDAEQLGAGNVTDTVIAEALRLVRQLWCGGIAHRDIKPANIAVSHGHVFLVDLSFGELRPTAWREAVDLAAMMLCLGLYAAPERVYAAALDVFTANEIGEAFAAARSVTIPTQLRELLKESDDDVRGRFEALLPHRPPIAIQRWSLRRLLLCGATLATVAGAVVLLAYNLQTVGLL